MNRWFVACPTKTRWIEFVVYRKLRKRIRPARMLPGRHWICIALSGKSCIPHIKEVIRREFPRVLGLECLRREAQQVEDLALKLGKLGGEDLDGARTAYQDMALGEAEQTQD